MKYISYAILFAIFLFQTHKCSEITSFYGYRDFKSGYSPESKTLWTIIPLNPRSKLHCLALSVRDQHCGGFLFDTDSGLCAGFDSNAEHTPRKTHGEVYETTGKTSSMFYHIKKNRVSGLSERTKSTTMKPGIVEIILHVKTGDECSAETTLDKIQVFIALVGKKLEVELELRRPQNTREPFQRGSNDTYKFTSSDMGEILEVKVKGKAKGSGDSWILDEIIIEKRVHLPDESCKVQIYVAELRGRVTKTNHFLNLLHPDDIKTLRLRKLREYKE